MLSGAGIFFRSSSQNRTYMCQKDTCLSIVSRIAGFYNKYMFTYMKIHHEILLNNRLDSRKLIDIFGTLLAVMLLCILAGNYTTDLQITEDAADNLNIPKNRILDTTETFSLTAGDNTGARLKKLSGIMAENKLTQVFSLPVVPKPAPVQEDKTVELSLPVPSAPKVPSAIIPEQPVIPKEPESSFDGPASVPDTGQNPSEEETEPQEFFCGGFLCDASGKIIGCQDASVIDGVLRLPSDASCTGIAAGALAPLSPQIYEIYIPANIISIDDGAFDCLTELFFIEVHPDNPVYTSRDGYLYIK